MGPKHTSPSQPGSVGQQFASSRKTILQDRGPLTSGSCIISASPGTLQMVPGFPSLQYSISPLFYMSSFMTSFFSLTKVHLYCCIYNTLLYLLPNNILLYELSIHQLVDFWVISTLWLLWVMLLWPFMCNPLCRHIFFHFPYIYTKEWNCWVVWFWRFTKMFSKLASSFYMPICNVGRLQFFHIMSFLL